MSEGLWWILDLREADKAALEAIDRAGAKL